MLGPKKPIALTTTKLLDRCRHLLIVRRGSGIRNSRWKKQSPIDHERQLKLDQQWEIRKESDYGITPKFDSISARTGRSKVAGISNKN